MPVSAAPDLTVPFRAARSGAAWRIDWMTPGGGVQSSLILDPVYTAKAMAGRSGRYVGQQATQLHGGMGMTDEMACGHYFKRLTAIDMTWGNAEHQVELFGEFL